MAPTGHPPKIHVGWSSWPSKASVLPFEHKQPQNILNGVLLLIALDRELYTKKGNVVFGDSKNIFFGNIIDTNTMSFANSDEDVLRSIKSKQECYIGSGIRHLELSYNRIGESGAEYLVKSLKKGSKVEVISLLDCAIGDKGLKHLADWLKTSTLAGIHLNSNYITNEGALHLAEVLKENSKLAMLDISGNAIKTEGFKSICESLKNNTTLTSLALIGNVVGDEGGNALLDCLQTNTTLKSLALDRTSISDAIIEKINEKIKINKAK